MRRVDIVRRPDRDERDRLVEFVETLTASQGRRPLSDHLWLDLQAGGGSGFVAVTAGELHAGAVRLLGLAQVSAANDGAVLEVAVATADDADSLTVDLADTAIDAARRSQAGRITWWVDDATTAIRDLAAARGLEPVRGLHEMRRPLPHPDRSAVPTRAFRPGSDDAAWIAVNNRAFAAHGEQGGWTADTLALRVAEPWFDADGFRIHDPDGSMLGFCWTKVHREEDPSFGEIYVIAVDPAAHGRGLGREMTLAGLDWLADRGITVATLYVDAANTAAVHLYERLGFELHRTRTAFSGTLEGS